VQPFGLEIVAMVDRHGRTTAVAINDFLAGAGEGQVPRAFAGKTATGSYGSTCANWLADLSGPKQSSESSSIEADARKRSDRRRIQPVDATDWLNISAGVW